MTRNPALDIARGVLLLLMTMTHLPTIWAGRFGEPLGFISAAEGFVFLSAFLAGKIFVEQQQRKGLEAATRWVFGRALRLYLIHLALLVIAFTVIAWIAVNYHRTAARNLLDLYIESPRKAAFSSVVLLYQPPLLDILPMYVLFFIGTAFVMRATARWGWQWVLAGSVLVWVAAQFGLRAALYDILQRVTGLDIPLRATGAFDLFAWQLLWVLGLWFGALGFGQTRQVLASSRSALVLALAVSCGMFFWRYYSGPGGFEEPAKHFFWVDKWTLSPVRLVNFAALVLVAIGAWSAFGKRSTFRIPFVERLGAASQWVFVAHIGSALLLLCFVGEDDQPLAGTTGVLILLIGYLALFIAGGVYHRLRERARQAPRPGLINAPPELPQAPVRDTP
jgi:hypothetical protein